jgi:autonomous glycyl radical cofactor GrcA
MDRNRTNEPRGRVTQAEKAEPMPHDMLTQAIANLEAVAAEMRCAVASPAVQCWADAVLTAVSDLKEVEAAPEALTAEEIALIERANELELRLIRAEALLSAAQRSVQP